MIINRIYETQNLLSLQRPCIWISRCGHVTGTGLPYENPQHVAEKENLKDSVIRISKVRREETWGGRKGSRQRRQRSKIRRKNQPRVGQEEQLGKRGRRKNASVFYDVCRLFCLSEMNEGAHVQRHILCLCSRGLFRVPAALGTVVRNVETWLSSPKPRNY